jgi:hypothetical protein
MWLEVELSMCRLVALRQAWAHYRDREEIYIEGDTNRLTPGDSAT